MNYKTQIARLLRQNQTKAEKKLWSYLRNRKFENLKFRRQHPIKEYILDFFCEEFGIIIELDGEYHNQPNQKEKDELRDLHLKELGFLVLRFENKIIFEQIDIVFETIKKVRDKQIKFALNHKVQLQKRKLNREKHPSPILSSRKGSSTILSTKILSLSQKELLLNAKLNFVEYDAIKIEFLAYNIDKTYDYYVFTSQNGVKSFLKKDVDSSILKNKAFCVGEKTKKLLQENGVKVVEIAQNSSKLSQIISKKYKKDSFLVFSGNLRRPELVEELKKNNITHKEHIVYKTHLVYKPFKQEFNGVLFFSPSGVKSFSKDNQLKSSLAFCIGETTATEAQKYTNKVIIANKQSIENVLVQAIKYFKND